MVQDVEELGAELHTDPLRDCRSLINREIPLLILWSAQRVPSQRPVVPGSRHTVRCRAVRAQSRIHRARYRKGTELHELVRIGIVLDDWPDHVRTVVAFA